MALTDNLLAYWNLNNNGSGGVSLLDSTGNGNVLINSGGVPLGDGIISGGAAFSGNGSQDLQVASPLNLSAYTISLWLKILNFDGLQVIYTDNTYFDYQLFITGSQLVIGTGAQAIFLNAWQDNNWHHVCVATNGSSGSIYFDGVLVNNTANYSIPHAWDLMLGNQLDGPYPLNGNLDEIGIWTRALTDQEISDLYNNGAGLTYPFFALFYNNAQNDGDWGNLLNWWQDAGFTNPATALPTTGDNVRIYGNVTKNTQGANQCFSKNATFWSANFGAGLTLQASGIVDLQGTSVFSGTSASGVSVHDSAQLAYGSVINGNVVMQDNSTARGSIVGNAIVKHPSENPIGGTVSGTTTYVWTNGTGLWGNEVWIDGSPSFIIPAESDVKAGVAYGPANDPYTGTYTGSGGGSNPSGINLAQLLGLPPYIQL